MDNHIRVQTWARYIHEHPKFTGSLINENNNVLYVKNGVWHRDNDLPAVEYSDGAKTWYKDGNCHRENAPANIAPDVEMWCVEGVKHRYDGPALTLHGNQFYYINGKEYSEKDYNVKIRMLKLKLLDDTVSQ